MHSDHIFIRTFCVAADNIDETYGVNVQFEESDDDVSFKLLLVV